MLALIIAMSICAAPSMADKMPVKASLPNTAPALARYIVRINHKVKPAEALTLAKRIVIEARRHGLDLPLFAAIAHTESHFRVDCKGRSYEHGYWQLWPWAQWLAPSWDRLRAVMRGLPGWPDKDWGKLGRKLQIKASRDPVIATYLAAHLLARHVHGKAPTARLYARYNSGNPRVRPFYVRALRRRSKAIRAVLQVP